VVYWSATSSTKAPLKVKQAKTIMSQSFGDWFNQLGPVTRASLVAVVGLSAVSSLNIVSPSLLVLTKEALTSLQVWRFATAAFYLGNFSFPWLMTVATFVVYTRKNEESNFKGKTADMVYMFLVVIAALSVGSLLLSFYVTSFSFLMSLCWIFCKRHPEEQLELFGFAFRSSVFPWVLMALHFIMGGGIMADILGIVVGHAYLFFKDVLPVTHHQRWLETPLWLQRRFPQPTTRVTSFGAEVHPYDPRFQTVRRTAAPQGGGSHNWGSGRALGSS
jgi:Derlin-2/3